MSMVTLVSLSDVIASTESVVTFTLAEDATDARAPRTAARVAI